MPNSKIDKRLLKKPKYKTGDTIVYADRYADHACYIKLYQSKIVHAWGFINKDTKEKKSADVLDWFYHTELTIGNDEDYLEERDIFYKL